MRTGTRERRARIGDADVQFADASTALAVFSEQCQAADEIHVAVAWATQTFPAIALLRRCRARVFTLVVGLDGYNTDPEFLEDWRATVRIHEPASGMFHPKVVLFRRGASYACILGSSNLTGGGFKKNVELNVVLRGGTTSSRFLELQSRILRLADEAKPLTSARLREYKSAFKALAKERLRVNQRPAGSPKDAASGARDCRLDVSWPAFVELLGAQPRLHWVAGSDDDSAGYFGTLEAVRRVFRRHRRLSDMTAEDRQVIGGFGVSGRAYAWFGHMRGAGKFVNAMDKRPEAIDRALGLVPRRGAMTESAMAKFAKRYSELGLGVGSGTRLLAMKRPDLFICVDSRNRRGLADAFGIPKSSLSTWTGYWNCMRRIYRCPWYGSMRPRDRMEQRIWDARVALLDAVYLDRSP